MSGLREVGTLRLVVPERGAAPAGRRLVEQAIRLAPDVDGSRVLVIRRLALGRIALDQGRVAEARVAEAVREAARQAVHAGDPGAADAPAVWFEDPAEAPRLAALALARGRPLTAWYWVEVAPRAARTADRERALQLLFQQCLQAVPEARAARLLLDEAAAAGLLELVVSALSPAEGAGLLAALELPAAPLVAPAFAPAVAVPWAASERAAAPAQHAQPIRACPPAWRGALRGAIGRWGPSDPRVRAVAICAGLAAGAPRAAAARWAAAWIHAANPGEVGPGDPIPSAVSHAHPPEIPRSAPSSAGAPRAQATVGPRDEAAADDPARKGALHDASPRRDERPPPPLARPTPAPRAQAAPASPGAEPISDPIAETERLPEAARAARASPSARLDGTPFHTRAGGLIALLNGLGRLGLDAALSERPDWLDRSFAERLLASLFDAAGLPPEEPLRALARLPDDAPRDPEIDAVVAAWVDRLEQACNVLLHENITIVMFKPAVATLTRTHLDLYHPLAAATVSLRRIGWDLDPGWVPWLGRILTLHYLDDEDWRLLLAAASGGPDELV